jgi:hypothetical protein
LNLVNDATIDDDNYLRLMSSAPAKPVPDLAGGLQEWRPHRDAAQVAGGAAEGETDRHQREIT